MADASECHMLNGNDDNLLDGVTCVKTEWSTIEGAMEASETGGLMRCMVAKNCRPHYCLGSVEQFPQLQVSQCKIIDSRCGDNNMHIMV